MARIELRDCTIRFKDGFGGSARIDDTSIASGHTTLEVNTIAGLTNVTPSIPVSTLVPVGARFSITGHDSVTYTVTAQNASEKQQLVLDCTDGTFTLALGATGDPTTAIDHACTAADIQAALIATDDFVLGDVVVTGTNPTFVIQFGGNYLSLDVPTLVSDVTSLIKGGGAGTATLSVLRPGGTTWELTFTPAIPTADVPHTTDVITFLPQQIEVKIGDGNLTYTEHRTYDYMLDRGNLDTVREGNEVPMDVKLECVYEHVTTGTAEVITPMDAVKGIGGASGWVSSSADQCEPYSVDMEVEHVPPCGETDSEITLFPDFRAETKEVNFKDANISLTGKCNVIEPIVTRV